MARDWEKYEAEIRAEMERKVADAVERAKRKAERAGRRAEWHAERAQKGAEWYAEQAKKQAERQGERASERLDRAARRGSSFWNSPSFAGFRIHGLGCDGKGNHESEIIFGLAILGFGAALLLSNLGVVEFSDLTRFWPILIIVMGLLRIGRARFVSAYAFGIFLTAAGVIFLLNSLEVIHASWNLFWPGVLILVGLQHLLKNFDPPKTAPQPSAASGAQAPPPTAGERPGPETPTSGPRASNSAGMPFDGGSSSSAAPQPTQPPAPEPGPGSASGSCSGTLEPDVHLHEYCIFTGGKRRIRTNNFRGGELVAVFGGIDIDLRDSQIGGNDAVIDITAAFGGCTIRVPESWYVEMRGVAAFGGYTDKTIPPRITAGQRIQKLIVTGSAAFGGVVIEN